MTAIVLTIPRLERCPAPATWDGTEGWDLIDFCPLYVESHIAREGASRHMGCVDDVAKPCRVHRGKMNFLAALERMRKVDARTVAACEFRVAVARMRGVIKTQERRRH